MMSVKLICYVIFQIVCLNLQWTASLNFWENRGSDQEYHFGSDISFNEIRSFSNGHLRADPPPAANYSSRVSQLTGICDKDKDNKEEWREYYKIDAQKFCLRCKCASFGEEPYCWTAGYDLCDGDKLEPKIKKAGFTSRPGGGRGLCKENEGGSTWFEYFETSQGNTCYNCTCSSYRDSPSCEPNEPGVEKPCQRAKLYPRRLRKDYSSRRKGDQDSICSDWEFWTVWYQWVVVEGKAQCEECICRDKAGVYPVCKTSYGLESYCVASHLQPKSENHFPYLQAQRRQRNVYWDGSESTFGVSQEVRRSHWSTRKSGRTFECTNSEVYSNWYEFYLAAATRYCLQCICAVGGEAPVCAGKPVSECWAKNLDPKISISPSTNRRHGGYGLCHEQEEDTTFLNYFATGRPTLTLCYECSCRAPYSEPVCGSTEVYCNREGLAPELKLDKWSSRRGGSSGECSHPSEEWSLWYEYFYQSRRYHCQRCVCQTIGTKPSCRYESSLENCQRLNLEPKDEDKIPYSDYPGAQTKPPYGHTSPARMPKTQIHCFQCKIHVVN